MGTKCVPEKSLHWWGATCDDVCLKKYTDCRLGEFETSIVARMQPSVADELVKNDRFTSNVANAVGKDNYTTRQIAKSVCSADDCTLLTPTIQRVAKPYVEAAVAPALQPLVADVAAVKKDLGGLRTDVDAAKTESAAASKKADDSRTSGLTTTMSMLKKVSDSVAKQIKDADASTSATVASLSQSLNKLGTDVAARIKAQQGALDEHTKSIQSIGASFKTLDKKLSSNLATLGEESKKRVEDMAKAMDANVKKRVGDLATGVSSITSALSTHIKKNDNVLMEVAKLTDTRLGHGHGGEVEYCKSGNIPGHPHIKNRACMVHKDYVDGNMLSEAIRCRGGFIADVGPMRNDHYMVGCRTIKPMKGNLQQSVDIMGELNTASLLAAK